MTCRRAWLATPAFVLCCMPLAWAGVRTRLPVSWHLTKAKAVGSGALTSTESFAETWSLDVLPDGRAFLSSPRAKVEVYGSHLLPDDKLPPHIIVAEDRLARLVGVALAEDKSLAPKLWSFDVAQSPKPGDEISLDLPDDEHVSLQLDLGTQGN